MSKLAIHGGAPVRTAPMLSYPIFGEQERAYLLTAFDSGKWWYGARVAEFEARFAAFQDAAFGVSCNSGTSALELALIACGMTAGDEVIIPSYTFIATATAVLRANAVPVFADIELATTNLTPELAEQVITPRTRAIIPVHFGGLPVDMDAFRELGQRHHLTIIEDACHSWGSQWRGKGTGALGAAGAFSFQMSKNITSGEGGMLLTNDENVATLAGAYANSGRLPGPALRDFYYPGGNLRMTELQAAILLAQLEQLGTQTQQRQENAAYLDRGLSGIPGIVVAGSDDPRVTRRAYHLYIFRHTAETWGVNRERFLAALQAEGIRCFAGYSHPVYRNPLFQDEQYLRYAPFRQFPGGEAVHYRDVRCPNAEQLCADACWIQHAVLLGNERDMQDIVDAVGKLWECRDEL